jgi:hypothetical protein
VVAAASRQQVVLGDFPVNIAVHPSGKFCVVLHSGYSTHELTTVRAARRQGGLPRRNPRVLLRAGVSPDGGRVYCSGAGDEVIHAFSFRDGYLAEPEDIRLRPVTERGAARWSFAQCRWPAGFSRPMSSGQDVIAADLGAPSGRHGLFPLRPGLPAVDLSQTKLPDDLESAAARKARHGPEGHPAGGRPIPLLVRVRRGT